MDLKKVIHEAVVDQLDKRLEKLRVKLNVLQTKFNDGLDRYIEEYEKKYVIPELLKRKKPGITLSDGEFLRIMLPYERRENYQRLYDEYSKENTELLKQIDDLKEYLNRLGKPSNYFRYHNAKMRANNPNYIGTQVDNYKEDDFSEDTDEYASNSRKRITLSIAKDLVKKYNLPPIKQRLGLGAESVAYLLENDTVLKLTDDDRVLQSWYRISKFKDNSLRHLAKIYKVGKVDDNMGDSRDTQYGFCIMEKVESLTDIERWNYSSIKPALNRIVTQNGWGYSLYRYLQDNSFNRHIINNIYKEAIKGSNDDGYKNLVYQYLDILAELGKYNLGQDLHDGNIGKRSNGEFVVYDYS